MKFHRKVLPAALTAALVLLPTAVPGTGVIQLPDMGASAGSALSLEEERRLGEAFMREMRRELRLVDDGEITTYLRSLGNRVSAHSDGGIRDFTLFAIHDPTINAFAAPGGYIGVHTGLILAAQSESELAAVLAHEIAHVTQRHIARSIDASRRMSLPYQAALIAAVILASKNSEVGQAAIAAAQAGAIQYQIDFTRDNEREADRVGMQTLSDAGFDPGGMPDFFARLEQAHRFQSKPPEFLSTHPVTLDRIAESRGRAERLPRRHPDPSLNFQLVRAKLEALEEREPKRAVERFARRLEGGLHADGNATRYGYALALRRAGRLTEARNELQRLLAAEPDRAPFMSALAAVERDAGRIGRALELYRDALALYPGDYALSRDHAETLLRAGRPGEARQALLPLLSSGHDDPGLRHQLARAAEADGRRAEAHRHMAEHHYLNGDLATAIQQLEAALDLRGDDDYETARANARLREIKEEYRDLKAAKER